MEVLTKKEVLQELRNYVDNFKTQREAAEAMGVHEQHLSKMLSDSIPLRPAAMKVLQLDRKPLYVRRRVKAKYLDRSERGS